MRLIGYIASRFDCLIPDLLESINSPDIVMNSAGGISRIRGHATSVHS